MSTNSSQTKTLDIENPQANTGSHENEAGAVKIIKGPRKVKKKLKKVEKEPSNDEKSPLDLQQKPRRKCGNGNKHE